MSFYTEEELSLIGFKRYGNDVKISRFARFYNPQYIEIGNHIRIDDFCILSASNAPFILEDYIHISAGAFLYGSGGLHIQSYSNISAGVKLYTVNDDYSGEYLVGPTVPDVYRNVSKKPISIGRYCVIGCNSVVLPGVDIPDGVAIGANSLVKQSLDEWILYAGNPVRYIKSRSKELLNYISNIV